MPFRRLNTRQKIIVVVTSLFILFFFIQTFNIRTAIRDSLVMVLIGAAFAILCKDR